MRPSAFVPSSTWFAGNVAALGCLPVGSRPNTMMPGAVSALPASTGPLESEGGRWWPPVGDFELAVAVWPAVARLDLDMVSSIVSRAAGIGAQFEHIGLYSYCQVNQVKSWLKQSLYQWLTVALKV